VKISLSFLLIFILVSLSSCGPVNPSIHEGDNRLNYRNIFHEDVPPDVNVVNSIYVTYHPFFRPGVVTTPDYEIELIATSQWIENKAKKFWLKKTEESWKDQARRYIEQRVKDRGREWYAPKEISEYESYLDAASIPYVHMLVDKVPVDKNRYRVFLSKH